MRRRRRLGLLLALGAVVAMAGAPQLSEPSIASLAHAVRTLGPIGGWRCAQTATYVYDPRRDSADRSLLSDAPEQFLRNEVPDLQVERVEVNLRGGDTVVWTRIGADATPRVYVLSPGRLQSIGIDLDSGWTTICTSQLGSWRIVAEQALK